VRGGQVRVLRLEDIDWVLSMIALIEPPMIAVMEPLESAQKAISDGFSN
jgi:hypothetical protein